MQESRLIENRVDISLQKSEHLTRLLHISQARTLVHDSAGFPAAVPGKAGRSLATLRPVVNNDALRP